MTSIDALKFLLKKLKDLHASMPDENAKKKDVAMNDVMLPTEEKKVEMTSDYEAIRSMADPLVIAVRLDRVERDLQKQKNILQDVLDILQEFTRSEEAKDGK